MADPVRACGGAGARVSFVLPGGEVPPPLFELLPPVSPLLQSQGRPTRSLSDRTRTLSEVAPDETPSPSSGSLRASTETVSSSMRRLGVYDLFAGHVATAAFDSASAGALPSGGLFIGPVAASAAAALSSSARESDMVFLQNSSETLQRTRRIYIRRDRHDLNEPKVAERFKIYRPTAPIMSFKVPVVVKSIIDPLRYDMTNLFATMKDQADFMRKEHLPVAAILNHPEDDGYIIQEEIRGEPLKPLGYIDGITANIRRFVGYAAKNSSAISFNLDNFIVSHGVPYLISIPELRSPDQAEAEKRDLVASLKTFIPTVGANRAIQEYILRGIEDEEVYSYFYSQIFGPA